MNDTTKFLEHYGVMGMRWGVRRAGRGAASVRSAKPKKAVRPSDEGKQAAKILAKQRQFGTPALTNHELRTINARQKLEAEFNKTNPRIGKIKKGEKFIKEALLVAGTAEGVYKLATSDFGKAAINKGKKFMGTAVNVPAVP